MFSLHHYKQFILNKTGDFKFISIVSYILRFLINSYFAQKTFRKCAIPLQKKMRHYMFFKKMLPGRICTHVVYERFLKLKQKPVLRCQRKMKDLLKSHWSKKWLLSLKEVHMYHVLYHTLIITLIRMTGGDRIINRVSG